MFKFGLCVFLLFAVTFVPPCYCNKVHGYGVHEQFKNIDNTYSNPSPTVRGWKVQQIGGSMVVWSLVITAIMVAVASTDKTNETPELK